MSRAGVRTAIVNWLASPNVANLNAVYASRMRALDEAEQTGGQFSTEISTGAIAFIRIGRQSETRIALGGPFSGKKRVDYFIELHVNYHTIGTGLDDQNVETETDALIDGIVSRLRADRTLGTASILEAGEGQFGIEITDPSFSETSENAYLSAFVVAFTVTEIATT